MGASKSDKFSKEHQDTAAIFKALSHPARIAIMQYLISSPNCICGDIVKELPLAQPTISQHLKELKLAGLIVGEIEGTAICYCINPDVLQKLQKFIEGITDAISAKPCC